MSATPKHPTLPMQHQAIDPLHTPLLVAVPDAARLLGIGTTFAWELVRAGDLPSVKLGRRVLIPRTALERLAASHLPEGIQKLDGALGLSLPPDVMGQRARDRAARKGESNRTRTT